MSAAARYGLAGWVALCVGLGVFGLRWVLLGAAAACFLLAALLASVRAAVAATAPAPDFGAALRAEAERIAGLGAEAEVAPPATEAPITPRPEDVPGG